MALFAYLGESVPCGLTLGSYEMSSGPQSPHRDRDQQAPLAGDLLLGALEAILNAALDLDPATKTELAALQGTVIRLRLADPHRIYYLLIDDDGVALESQLPSDRHVDVRIQTTWSTLLCRFLGWQHDHSYHDSFRVAGDQARIDALQHVLQGFNLRALGQTWLREHLDFHGLLDKLKQREPGWIAEFAPIPGLLKDALAELRQLNQSLHAQQQEFVHFQQRLARQRSRDIVFLMVATLALVSVFSQPLAQMNVADTLRSLEPRDWLLIITSFALIISRLQQKA